VLYVSIFDSTTSTNKNCALLALLFVGFCVLLSLGHHSNANASGIDQSPRFEQQKGAHRDQVTVMFRSRPEFGHMVIGIGVPVETRKDEAAGFRGALLFSLKLRQNLTRHDVTSTFFSEY
jgi:hypothetical protein